MDATIPALFLKQISTVEPTALKTVARQTSPSSLRTSALMLPAILEMLQVLLLAQVVQIIGLFSALK